MMVESGYLEQSSAVTAIHKQSTAIRKTLRFCRRPQNAYAR